jgi:hypothetical protein
MLASGARKVMRLNTVEISEIHIITLGSELSKNRMEHQ